MMKAMLGGMRGPRVPPAASEPVASFPSYLRCSSSGRATVPMAAAVATLEPDTAENRPQAAMLEWSRPPGMSWNQRERPR